MTYRQNLGVLALLQSWLDSNTRSRFPASDRERHLFKPLWKNWALRFPVNLYLPTDQTTRAHAPPVIPSYAPTIQPEGAPTSRSAMPRAFRYITRAGTWMFALGEGKLSYIFVHGAQQFILAAIGTPILITIERDLLSSTDTLLMVPLSNLNWVFQLTHWC